MDWRSFVPTPSLDSRVSPAMLQILLALAEEDLHGYGIMHSIDERTEGSVEIGPGTLYRTLGHLRKRGWIEETESGEGSRRTYRITPSGRTTAADEVRRLSKLVSWAVESDLMRGAE